MLRFAKLMLAVAIAFGGAGLMSAPTGPTRAFAQATSTATASPPASLAVVTTSLDEGRVGTSYLASLFATGGSTPYTWTLTSGALPAGLGLTIVGTIIGTPTTTGFSNFTLRVTDNAGTTASWPFTMAVQPATLILTSTVPAGRPGAAYLASLTASGGTAPYIWGVLVGATPSGITLDATGKLSGTPSAAGTTTFTVRGTDANGLAATQTLVLVVNASVAVDTSLLPNAQPGVAYSTTLAASGGTAAYTWKVTSGALPAGLSLSASGTVTGTPTSAGAATFTVQTTDALGASATRALTLTVGGQGGSSSISIPSVGFGIVVFGGGTVTELVAAANCMQQTLAFWATVNGQFVGYVPNTTIGAVNAQFLSAFPGGVLPPSTPLVARC